MIEKPNRGTYPEYFDPYIQLLPDDINVLTFLENQVDSFVKVLDSTIKQSGNSSYQENKWTPKEVLGHLLDTERILSFRAFFIARGDDQNLPGFEQDDYVKAGDFNHREFDVLVEEFLTVRTHTIQLFKSFPLPLYQQSASINGSQTVLAAMPFIIAGHVAHHESILKEKYIV